ncbi:pathogenesis-related protein 1 [Cryptomeria japonica]|uniref:pathogenesis-related protein 1 n=1 Tax=Cryptomeria japonica TaxID=3369 RepID=UPI0025AC1FE9|nr:pathogenesis-related protein 1 [Cryptomeria japonica]
MVVGSIRHEIESAVEAKRLWNAFVKDGHNLLPKQIPELFSSITLLQGEGGVGTIKKINFTPVNKDFSYVKERVEELDEENFVYRSTHVEGGTLGKKLASASYEFKYTPKAEGGCLCSSVFHYDSLPGVMQNESKVQEIKCAGTALFKKIESYLLANPTMYC